MMNGDDDSFALAMFIVVMIAAAIYFVLTTPAPDYMLPFGSGTQPIEMRD